MNSGDRGYGEGDLRRTSFFKQEENLIAKFISLIKGRLFTANYIMVKSFQMPLLLYLFFLLVEFLQLLYFSLFKLDVINQIGQGSVDADTIPTNSTEIKKFNLDSDYNVLKLINYQMLILKLSDRHAYITYQVALSLHLAFFVLLFASILLLGRRIILRSEKIFSEQGKGMSISSSSAQNMSNEIDQNNMGVQKNMHLDGIIISCLFFVGNSLLTIPTFFLISTSFDCTKLQTLNQYAIDEAAQDSNNSTSTVQTFECLNKSHILLLSICIVVGLFIVGLLAIQCLFFTDINMRKGLPWSQQPNRISQLRLLQKLICVMFNFDVLTDKPVASGIFCGISFFILIKRYQFSRIYNKKVRRVIYFFDAAIFWFSFWTFLSYSSFYVNIYSFTILMILGFLPFYLFIVEIFDKGKRQRFLLKEYKRAKQMGSEINAETYFGYLIELIKNSTKSEKSMLLLFGYLRSHWYDCKKGRIGECSCSTLIQRIDILKEIIEEEEMITTESMEATKLQRKIDELEEDIKNQQNKNRFQESTQYQSRRLDNIIREINQENSDNNLSPSFGHSEAQMESMGDSVSNVQQIDLDFQEEKKVTLPNVEAVEDAVNEYNKNQILKKKIKKTFYKFVYQLIEEATQEFPFSFRLKYLAAFVQFHYLKNAIKGLFEILMIEKRNKIPLEWQFFLFKVKAEIEDDMEAIYNERAKGYGRIDVNKVYQFQKYLQDFEIKIGIVSEKCVDFWKELLKVADFDANNLHKIGTHITLLNLEIVNLVNLMFEINPNHGFLLRMYALFLQHVMNNEEDGQKYYAKFVNAQKTFSHYQSSSLKEELLKNFSSNIKYVIIVMRVTTSEIGIIEDANHEIKPLLGYRRQEIIKKNLSMLMPKCVGKLHDQFVQNYLDTAKPKILYKQREIFALKKNGHIIQSFIYVTSVPMIAVEGIKFVGFLKKVEEKSHTALLPPPPEYQHQKSMLMLAAPNGNIYGMNEHCFKYLGLPTYFIDEDDERLSDYNMNFLVKNYKKVLFDCLRYSPAPQKAILSTAGFKNYIVQEMHSKEELKHIKNTIGKFNVVMQAQPIDYGYQGGAFLPTILFRIYIEEKLQKMEFIQKQLQKSTMASKFLMKSQSRRNMLQNNSGVMMSSFDEEIEKKFHDTANLNSDPQGSISDFDSDRSDDDTPYAKPKSNKNGAKQVQIVEQKIGPQNKEDMNAEQIKDFLFSSMSSASMSKETKSQDLARLKDFRKMVSSRTEPVVILKLRRVVLFITLIASILIGINLGFKVNFYSLFQNESTHYNLMNDIIIDLHYIKTGFRSLINIENGLQDNEVEYHVKDGELSTLIQNSLEEYIQELNENKNMLVQIQGELEDSINKISENFYVDLINANNITEREQQSLNLALSQVISKSLLLLKDESIEGFKNKTFVEYINRLSNRTKTVFGPYGNEIDDVTQNLYYLEKNLFEKIIVLCQESQELKIGTINKHILRQKVTFIVLLSTVIAIIIFSLSVLFVLGKNINKTRIQSLSLYSELKIKDVQNIINKISMFVNLIKEQSEVINESCKNLEEEDEKNDDEYEDYGGHSLYKDLSAIKSDYVFDDVEEHDDEEEDEAEAAERSQESHSFQEEPTVNMSMNQSSAQIVSSSLRQPRPSQIFKEEKRVSMNVPNKKEKKKEPEKIGHNESFKMVTSNSGRGFMINSSILFVFFFLYVALSFIIFEPFYQQLQRMQPERDSLLSFERSFIKLYIEMINDISKGYEVIDETLNVPKFQHYVDKNFELSKEINLILKDHTSFLDYPVQTLLDMESSNFCSTLKSNLVNSTWNETFCETIDHEFINENGLKAVHQRFTSQLNQIRISFVEFMRQQQYDRMIELFNKDQWSSKAQMVFYKLQIPSYKILRDHINESTAEAIQSKKSIDIIMICVFIVCQLFIMLFLWPRFLKRLNEQIMKSRGILILIPNRLIITNKNIQQFIKLIASQ